MKDKMSPDLKKRFNSNFMEVQMKQFKRNKGEHMTIFKKFMVVLLAVVLVFGQVGFTAVSFAGLNNDDEDNSDYTLSGADEYLKEIRGYRNAVEAFTPANESEQQIVDEFMESSAELEEAIEILGNPEAQTGPEAALVIAKILELYPPHTIIKRIELLAQTVDIITFATTELRDKPVEIQRSVAEFAIRGLAIAVMPGDINDAAEEHLMALDEMKEYWSSANDASMEDAANIYHKSDLDKLLAEARKMKNKQLKNKPTYVWAELKAEIKRITKERLEIGVTKGEILKLKNQLQAAITKALENRDKIATRSEIKTLKGLALECRRAAKYALKQNNNAAYRKLIGLVREAKTELKIGNYKKSQDRVLGLIDSMLKELGK